MIAIALGTRWLLYLKETFLLIIPFKPAHLFGVSMDAWANLFDYGPSIKELEHITPILIQSLFASFIVFVIAERSV
jgi:hypothetical protein